MAPCKRILLLGMQLVKRFSVTLDAHTRNLTHYLVLVLGEMLAYILVGECIVLGLRQTRTVHVYMYRSSFSTCTHACVHCHALLVVPRHGGAADRCTSGSRRVHLCALRLGMRLRCVCRFTRNMSCALLQLVERSALVHQCRVLSMEFGIWSLEYGVLSSTCAAGERALQRLAPEGVERDVERFLLGGQDDQRVRNLGTATTVLLYYCTTATCDHPFQTYAYTLPVLCARSSAAAASTPTGTTRSLRTNITNKTRRTHTR